MFPGGCSHLGFVCIFVIIQHPLVALRGLYTSLTDLTIDSRTPRFSAHGSALAIPKRVADPSHLLTFTCTRSESSFLQHSATRPGEAHPSYYLSKASNNPLAGSNMSGELNPSLARRRAHTRLPRCPSDEGQAPDRFMIRFELII